MTRDHATLRAIEDVHPRFIWWHRAIERPNRQIVEPSREPRVGIAAGLRLGVDLYRSHNRDTVPGQHFDAILECRLPAVVRRGRPVRPKRCARNDESWA